MTRILLVDDDANLRNALQATMTSAGHEVTVAPDGLQALASAVVNVPDVIVSDVHMPLLEGPDMVRMLQAAPRLSEVRVILMSGLDSEAGVPVERLLRKPFEPALLLDCVAGARRAEALRVATAAPAKLRDPGKLDTTDARAMCTTAKLCATRARRGLELIREQAERIERLKARNRDAAVAEQLYEALLGSVSALVGLELVVTATAAKPACCAESRTQRRS